MPTMQWYGQSIFRIAFHGGHIISIWFPPHLDVRSSLAPALADLGCICPGLLQFVASLPCKDWPLIIGESLCGHDFIKIPNLRDFDNWWGLFAAVLSRGRSHPWVHYELPLGLVARVELRFMGVVERLVGKSARLCSFSSRFSKSYHILKSFNLSDGVWAVPQQCVIGQDVLKFSCLWFSFQISH